MAAHIIAKTGGINYDDDTYYLGLALYRRGKHQAIPPEELKAKADNLLAYLLRGNRIEMGPDRQVRVTSSRRT
jgi:hypothetical protein